MREQKKIFGIIEIILINFLLFFLDINLKYFGYVLINPNPYFIFNLFVSIRYGINLSLFSGIISTILTFISIYLNSNNDFLNIIITWEVLKIPLFTLSLGVIVGFFRDMYVQQINILSDKVELLKNKINLLEEDIRKYKNVTDDLEQKLVLEKKGVSLLVDRLKEIEYDNSEDIFNEAIDLISDFISAKTVSIYTLSKNNFLRLKVRKGEQFLPNSFDLEKSVVLSLAKEFGSANTNVLFLTESEYNFEYEPAMAVSITENKNVLGFIIVEVIDPEKINKNTEIYLKILADWLSTLLYASTELTEKINTVSVIEKFNDALEKIEERRIRFKIPYSVIIAKSPHKISEENLKSFIRDTDFIFYDETSMEFRIILTLSTDVGLHRVLEKIKNYDQNIEILEAYTKYV
ncbi:hypothetical protein [Marinitoga litoralis]|uniref:hypothetical protein n=1 Tax=Marinitoga litoralis TaxID=570855 RepID=UPI00196104CA|nr:hypothetical protein [Marinitoga litoralis]MBM7558486.1 hypothetical protein [Marinitoga litoralis]